MFSGVLRTVVLVAIPPFSEEAVSQSMLMNHNSTPRKLQKIAPVEVV